MPRWARSLNCNSLGICLINNSLLKNSVNVIPILKARYIGKPLLQSLTKKSFTGSVVGIYQDFCNIRGNDGRMITIAISPIGKSPFSVLIESQDLKQMTDVGVIEDIIDGIIANNSEQVEQFKSGNTKLLGYFVGQVMKATQGKANPKQVNQILNEKLS